MFTGIIEDISEVVDLQQQGSNLNIFCRSSIAREFKINQSIAHNGVCLSVVDINNDIYQVTAVKETLSRSNLNLLEIGSKINIERSMQMSDRLDGHIVQGHIDTIAICKSIRKEKGSYFLTFEYDDNTKITVEKGSVCVNGISLTVCNSIEKSFSVAIIPYTYEHTNLHLLKEEGIVNIEFDILGKYIARIIKKDY
jgi:riboflavin synthase